MTSKVGFASRALLGARGYRLAVLVCSAVWDAQPPRCPGSSSIGLRREQPLEESLIAPWAVVVWRQACAFGGTASWCWLRSHWGAGVPPPLRGPMASHALRDAGGAKVRRFSQELLGASTELLAKSWGQKVPL